MNTQPEVSSLSQLSDLVDDPDLVGIYSLKPKVFLQALENNEPPAGRGFEIFFPPVAIGSPSVFEVSMICLLVRLLEPQKIVEIGTYTGYTTAILARNSPGSCCIFSIDLPPGDYSDNAGIDSDVLKQDWRANDNFLRHVQNDLGEIYLQGLGKTYANKINLIKEDSRNLSAQSKRLMNNADMVFIDGGHSFDIVKSDTEMAFSVLAEEGIVLLHDYGSSIHTEVTRYVDHYLSKEKPVFRLMGTSIAICLACKKTLSRMVSMK